MKKSARISEVWVATALVAVLVASAGCANGPVVPVAIDDEDMCGYCRMAISERQYAAELIDRNGKVEKFDDIGCLVDHIKDQKPDPAAYFVVDFNSREWVKAEDALLVRSPELKTPMAGGIVAFKNASDAQQAANAFRGTVMRFSELPGS